MPQALPPRNYAGESPRPATASEWSLPLSRWRREATALWILRYGSTEAPVWECVPTSYFTASLEFDPYKYNYFILHLRGIRRRARHCGRLAPSPQAQLPRLARR